MIIKTNIYNGIISIAASYLNYESNNNGLHKDFANEEDFVAIVEEPGIINGIAFLEGELLFNTDIDVKVSVDIDGTLTISDNDAENVYFINENGELMKNIF